MSWCSKWRLLKKWARWLRLTMSNERTSKSTTRWLKVPVFRKRPLRTGLWAGKSTLLKSETLRCEQRTLKKLWGAALFRRLCANGTSGCKRPNRCELSSKEASSLNDSSTWELCSMHGDRRTRLSELCQTKLTPSWSTSSTSIANPPLIW